MGCCWLLGWEVFEFFSFQNFRFMGKSFCNDADVSWIQISDCYDEGKPQNPQDDYTSTISRPGLEALRPVHRLGSLHTKMDDKIWLLTWILDIPFTAIT